MDRIGARPVPEAGRRVGAVTPVDFPPVEVPLVSIVMVTYGGFDWVMGALAAIVDHTDACYEVIVVDNASPDGTGARLSEAVSGACIVHNALNVGFGAGANQGALLARGRHVFFLNSDAFVQAGWLTPLLAVLDADPEVAAAASCLVDPDGTLQEAGGLVGAHGYAGQLGMGADPTRPEYRFRRQVDFASAAALLVRRREFLAVGGFHPSFVMGYFEDVDLCLELARRGLRTVYEPASVVRHMRGASTAPGEAQARATVSHAVFLRRWSAELDRRPPIAELEAYPHRLVAARDFVATERVLAVCAGTPDESLSVLVKGLATLWPTARITVAALEGWESGAELEAWLCAGVEVALGEGDWDRWFDARRFHYSVVLVDAGAATEAFDAVLARTQPQAARVQVARFEAGPVDTELRAVRDADVVVCTSARAHELVIEWAGDRRGVALGPSPAAGDLVDAMAGIGMAPPAARVGV
jgi:GT2 family glycosyltransferase